MCVCVCMRERERVCVCACARERERRCVCVCVQLADQFALTSIMCYPAIRSIQWPKAFAQCVCEYQLACTNCYLVLYCITCAYMYMYMEAMIILLPYMVISCRSHDFLIDICIM